jgi:hypothetical protein
MIPGCKHREMLICGKFIQALDQILYRHPLSVGGLQQINLKLKVRSRGLKVLSAKR